MTAKLTRWWWIRHAPVPDGGFIYGQRDLDCDCGDAEIFGALARELPTEAVWVTSNLVRTQQTAAAILAAAAGRHGAVEPLAVPDPGPMVGACNNPMVRAESAVVHSRLLKERPDELQPAVRDRLAPGLGVSAYEYLQGQRLRARFTREFIGSVFSRIDVLVTPTIPEPAPALAAAKAGATTDVIARMGRFSRLTRPFNALGLPALSIPCGASADGRPLAMQLVGRPFEEATLLRLGDAYERATGWLSRRPALP